MIIQASYWRHYYNLRLSMVKLILRSQSKIFTIGPEISNIDFGNFCKLPLHLCSMVLVSHHGAWFQGSREQSIREPDWDGYPSLLVSHKCRIPFICL